MKTSASSFIGRRAKTKRSSTSTEKAPAVLQHRMFDDGVFLYSPKSSPKELRLTSTERRRASSASERSDSTSRSAGEPPPAVDDRRRCMSDRSNVWSVAARFIAASFSSGFFSSLRRPSTAARILLPPVVLFGGLCRSIFMASIAFPASSSCLKMAFSLANSLVRVSWRGFICSGSASIHLRLASSLARSSASNLARSAASSASAAS